MRYFRNESGTVFGYDSEQQEYIDEALLEGLQEITGNWPLAQPLSVPQVVSRFQARAVLTQEGLITQVQSYIDSLPSDSLVKLAWEHAQEFRRQSPSVLQIGLELSLSEEQLDDLFILAASIQV